MRRKQDRQEGTMTFREIAAELGWPRTTVEYAFYRAMKKLEENKKLKDLLKLVASKDYVDLNASGRSRRARRNRRNPCQQKRTA